MKLTKADPTQEVKDQTSQLREELRHKTYICLCSCDSPKVSKIFLIKLKLLCVQRQICLKVDVFTTVSHTCKVVQIKA